MRILKIKNSTDIKKFLALVGESCDNSIKFRGMLIKQIQDVTWSRLVTYSIIYPDGKLDVNFCLLDQKHPDNPTGEPALEVDFNDGRDLIPILQNNITDYKETVIEITNEIIVPGIKKSLEDNYNVYIEVNVVGD